MDTDHATLILFNKLFLGFFFMFVAVFYTVLIWVKQTKTRQKVVNKGTKYSLHWFNHLIFGVFRATILLVCITRIFIPSLDDWLIIFDTHLLSIFIGQVCMIAGFGLAMWASMTMKQAWRSGVDVSGSQTLITQGVYTYSRNPNYLGVQIAQLGFFMALPSVFTLICLLIGLICIHIQVRLEEIKLNQQFNQKYKAYCLVTPRWFALNKAIFSLSKGHNYRDYIK